MVGHLIRRALQALSGLLCQTRRVLLCITLAVLLSGCAEYDLALNFHHAQSSQLVQSLRLDRRISDLTALGSTSWLDAIAQRTRHLGGRVQQQNDEELTVSLPFGSGRDLEETFAQLVAPLPAKSLGVRAELQLQQRNLLLAVRDRLTLRADLRGLGIQSEGGEALVSPGRLLALTVHLSTPWGFRRVEGTAEVQGNGLTWTLKPGKVNDLVVVFWLPSPLGWGALIVAGLVGVGWLIRSRVGAVIRPANQALSDTAPEGTKLSSRG